MFSQPFLVFLQVAESGSFSKAAARLLVTPASVMKHMNTLEGRLGLTLVRRSNQGIELTAAGQVLYQEGRKLFQAGETALAKAREAERARGISIRVGSSFLNPSRVLTDRWAPFREAYPQYKFSIVPYEETKEQILSVIASLGERIDVLVGAFNSKSMQENAGYLLLGSHRLCVAVPKTHPLAAKEALTLEDLHGEHLVMVKRGETELLDHFRDRLHQTHPQIHIEEAGYYYDVDTFNTCEQQGKLLLTLDAWADIHPSLCTLPVAWGYRIPYGILFPRHPSENVRGFLALLQEKGLAFPPEP